MKGDEAFILCFASCSYARSVPFQYRDEGFMGVYMYMLSCICICTASVLNTVIEAFGKHSKNFAVDLQFFVVSSLLTP